MSWIVVKFDGEETVEAVPKTWYIEKNSQCYWPPEGTVKHVIIDFIKKKHQPAANWMLYEASVLGIYDNYKKAQQKANKARNTNILSSNNEELKQKKKHDRKKNRRPQNKSNSEYELSSETEISSDDSVYPDVPIEQINSRNKFEKRVFRELHLLSLKIDDISEGINALLKNKADKVKQSVCNEIPEIIQSFPLNENSLAELEDWLMNSEDNKTILSQNLSRIGGSCIKEIVRRIMYRVFTNEVGMSYSWEGAKKKKVFKNLAVASVILSAVRLNKNAQECTDSEIICFIKAWLVRSKDRFNNNNKGKNIAPQRVEIEESTH
ncbi:uncharacterized protein [Linepithema humile]|uniref:uncharacterized protein isoform X1 n=1 Tax=Linepithema humile TaxID=83485 RepID=UPI00351EBBD7